MLDAAAALSAVAILASTPQAAEAAKGPKGFSAVEVRTSGLFIAPRAQGCALPLHSFLATACSGVPMASWPSCLLGCAALTRSQQLNAPHASAPLLSPPL